MATEDAQVIVQALEDCRQKSKGQYINNVLAFCKKEFDWDGPKTMEAIEAAKSKGIVRQVNNSDKCLRIVEGGSVSTPLIPDERIETSSPSKQVGEVDEEEDLIDFEKYIHSELLSIKAHVFNRSLSESVNNGSSNFNYEKMFIKSLEDRIMSLEKQLHQKQGIIDKLLEQPCRIVETTSTPAIPATHGHAGGAEKNSPSSRDKNSLSKSNIPQSTVKGKGNNNSITKEQSKPIETSKTAAQKKNGSNSKTNLQEMENKRKQNNNAPTEKIRNDAVSNKKEIVEITEDENDITLNGTSDDSTGGESQRQRKRVFVVGDSIINGIEEKGLSKKHNVRLRKCPGDTTEDLLDHIKPIARKKPDLVVIHFGTNDTTSGKDTKENMQKAIDAIREESPGTEIAISLCTIRKDRQGIEKKVTSCNKILRDAAFRKDTYVIDNKNIDESCLGMKKLHLNRKGTSFLANNLKNFINDI